MGDRLLLARRSGNRSLAGLWELPGGKVETGESEQDCLARELLEEFEIRVEIGSFIAESLHVEGDSNIRLRAYRVTPDSYNFVLNDHDALAWVQRRDVSEMAIAPADVPLLAHIWPLLGRESDVDA